MKCFERRECKKTDQNLQRSKVAEKDKNEREGEQMSKRILKVVCAILTASALLCACSISENSTETSPVSANASEAENSDEGNPVTSDAAAVERPLIFRIKTEPDTLDPHKTSGTGDPQVVQYQVFESLFREEQDGTVVPALADSYEFNADGTVMTVYLRQDVFFHDGTQMTADDVEFSINRSMSTGFNGVYVDAIQSVEKVDDFTVNINLKYAYTPIISCLSSLSTAIVPKAYVEANGDDILARQPIGTGAYKFISWTSGTEVVFEAFEQYWRGEAAIKDLTFSVIADNNTSVIALETGEVDIDINLSNSSIPTIEANSDLKEYSGPKASMMLFSFDNQKGVFSDPRMREAVYLCVDRQAIVDSCLGGRGEVTYACMLQMLDEYPDDFTVPERNVERAKELVAEAGYPDGVTVTAVTIDNNTYKNPTVMLQEQLKECGINLEIELMDRAAWNEQVITNTNYEITCWAIPVTTLDADFAASKFYGPLCNGGGNFSNCNYAEIDELIEAGRVAEPGEERNEIYRQFCQEILNNYVVCPIYTSTREIAANANLQGVATSATSHYFVYDYYWSE